MNQFATQLPDSVQGLNFSFSSFLTSTPVNILWGILGVLGIIIGGVTIVLYYHWLRYGFRDRMVIFAQVLYTLIVLVGFIVLIGSLSSYE